MGLAQGYPEPCTAMLTQAVMMMVLVLVTVVTMLVLVRLRVVTR